MKFRTQLFLGNGIVLLLMLIIAVVQFNSISSMSETSKWVDFTYQAIEKANTLNRILGEMESADRGFLLAGDEKYLEPYYNGKEDFEETFISLKEQLVINPQQTARLRDINKLVQSWHQKVAMPEIELRKKVAQDSAANMNHVLAAVKNDVGRNLMEDIRSRLQEVADTERALLDERAKENETVSNLAINVSTYGTLLALALGCMVALFISRSLMQQIGGEPAEVADIAKRVSEGDLTMEFSNENRTGLYGSIQNMVEKLKEVISSVTSAADNISSASQQMSGSSQQMSEGATEQAASAEEVSSSMEEMAANIQQNTDNAQQTEKIALQVSEDVSEGSRAVNQTVDSMRKIAEKISIIGEIARQTNLLALNAAVEAARAGEHGKGFAVVASEVRKLAERSQVAANEINELSSSSVAIADKSGRLLEQIVPNIQKTTRLVQEITAASMEQNGGAGQVNNAIQQLNQIIQQNAASAEEMASGSEELSSQADQLKDTVSFFNIGNRAYSQSSKSSRKRKGVPVVHLNGSGKGLPKKAHSGKTGLQLDMNGHDSMDQEFERF